MSRTARLTDVLTNLGAHGKLGLSLVCAAGGGGADRFTIMLMRSAQVTESCLLWLRSFAAGNNYEWSSVSSCKHGLYMIN